MEILSLSVLRVLMEILSLSVLRVLMEILSLSVLRVLMKILTHVSAKEETQRLKGFTFHTLLVALTWHHGSDGVNGYMTGCQPLGFLC